MSFQNGKELLAICHERNETIAEVLLDCETRLTGVSKEEIKKEIGEMLEVMEESAHAALERPIPSISGMVGGDAKKAQAVTASSLSGRVLMRAMAMALSTSEVNASMGKIVAAPTAGASGILPAVLVTLKEERGLDRAALTEAFLTATAIGTVIAKNATFSGAEGGCQAECGSAAAMAAGAIVTAMGGTPEMALDSANIAITNIMGLVCDSVAGLVEYPCALRNASGAVNAFTTADLVLAGIKPLVPFDEVVTAMYKVGKALPYTLKETGLGGVAATPTGCTIRKQIFGEDTAKIEHP